MKTFDEFFDAYRTQTSYMLKLLVNADNAIDMAHAERCPLPFQSCMVEDCIGRGKSLQNGGAIYNFTGPQGFGIANVTDAMYAIKKLVFEDKKYTLAFVKEALENNYGKDMDSHMAAKLTQQIAASVAESGKMPTAEDIKTIYLTVQKNPASDGDKQKYDQLLSDIANLTKFGNDDDDIDEFAREIAYTYTKPLEQYKNPRGGIFQAGLYPVSANVPLGAQTGATPDGRLAYTPIADGVSPAAGRDVKGPTAAANSVSRLDHYIASNGTLFNMKFHPSALEGRGGLESFVALVRGYFDRKGSHMQFNVVSRETLRDAQKHPEKYKSLVVRVAGYSALFTTLSKGLQEDIINRTEQQGF
jgi:formate C-acetyltransferase